MNKTEILESYNSFLLDTCILQDLVSRRIGEKIQIFIDSFLADEKILKISDYTVFELLRGATYKKEREGWETLNKFKRYAIDTNVLSMAAVLHTLYQNERQESGISDGDKILAATSIIVNEPIITRDGNDFPIPFFKEIGREIIEYTRSKGKRLQTTVIYFLKPDYQIIQRKFFERV